MGAIFFHIGSFFAIATSPEIIILGVLAGIFLKKTWPILFGVVIAIAITSELLVVFLNSSYPIGKAFVYRVVAAAIYTFASKGITFLLKKRSKSEN